MAGTGEAESRGLKGSRLPGEAPGTKATKATMAEPEAAGYGAGDGAGDGAPRQSRQHRCPFRRHKGKLSFSLRLRDPKGPSALGLGDARGTAGGCERGSDSQNTLEKQSPGLGSSPSSGLYSAFLEHLLRARLCARPRGPTGERLTS